MNIAKISLLFLFLFSHLIAENLIFIKPNTIDVASEEKTILRMAQLTGDEVTIQSYPYKRMLLLMDLEGKYIGTALSKATIDRLELPHFGPLYYEYIFIYAHKDHPLDIASLEEAKKLDSLGVIKGTFLHKLLADQGFANLKLYKNASALQKNLLLNRVTAIVPPEGNFAEGGSMHDPAIVSTGVMVMDNSHYIAFSKKTPKETVKRWQNTFEKFKRTKEYVAIRETPDEVTITPQNTLKPNKAPSDTSASTSQTLIHFITPGLLEDTIAQKIITKLAEITNDQVEFGLLPTKRLQLMMDQKPDYAGLGMFKKNIDEKGYAHMGPLHDQYIILFAHEDKPLDIGTLEEAKNLKKIGVINGSFVHKFLKEQGFKNLRPFKNVRLLRENLLKNRIDAFAASEEPFAPGGVHHDPKIVSTGIIVMDISHYVGFAKNMPKDVIRRWQDAFEKFKRTREYIQIIEPED